MAMKIGDIVAWRSQSQGTWKRKQGAIVSIISSGCRPDNIKGCGLSRDHESYVVKIGNKLYWPRVSAIELIHHAGEV